MSGSTVALLFSDTQVSLVRPLVDELMEHCGVLGEPTIKGNCSEITVTATLSGKTCDGRSLDRFVDEWVQRQRPRPRYRGIREV